MKLAVAKSSATLLVLLAILGCSLCSAASSNAQNSPIALPESRLTKTLHRRHNQKLKVEDYWVSQPKQYDPVATATSSLRGGAATLPVQGIYGVMAMAAIEAGLKKIFAATNINFPSQLGGCIVLFFVTVLAQAIHPGWGDSIYNFLEPGSALLSKWLPSFFVPGLAMLPLAPSVGSGFEVGVTLGYPGGKTTGFGHISTVLSVIFLLL